MGTDGDDESSADVGGAAEGTEKPGGTLEAAAVLTMG